ncbi:4001_t:CDS:2 [Funneliformis geosporum]|uniref:9593_t:CDS:1 n=1 Tax=Funneliformis geosporum TaxID=1117311 RepID=A0A9W4WL37_9GLOM|nr:4001_t:CDS:2 [Funneliformis geosporum]CAI2170071.1 9593_t:CDS:2 [Funneliformis geosporum]
MVLMSKRKNPKIFIDSFRKAELFDEDFHLKEFIKEHGFHVP